MRDIDTGLVIGETKNFECSSRQMARMATILESGRAYKLNMSPGPLCRGDRYICQLPRYGNEPLKCVILLSHDESYVFMLSLEESDRRRDAARQDWEGRHGGSKL